MSERIDAAVAEKVMGWTISMESGKHWSVPPDSHFFREWDNATWPHAPEFSTDIAAAWECIRLTDSMSLERGLVGGAWKWTCSIARDNDWGAANDRMLNGHPWMAIEDTAPRAIALAALRAVGVDTTELEKA